MADFEKNRAEYVMHLELLVQNLQKQLADIKAGEHWVPRFGTELRADESKARLTLSLNGKNATAAMSYDFLASCSATDATTTLLENAYHDFINDQLRGVVQPEVERLQQGIRSISSAGKW